MYIYIYYHQVKSGVVIVSLRKANKGEWAVLTGTEKKLKDTKEYV